MSAGFGPSCGRSSAASCWQSFSASGSLTKVLLQYELGSDRVHRALLHAAQPALRLDGAETLIDARDRKTEPTFELAREAFHPLRQRMFAIRCHGQTDDELRGPPLFDQAADGAAARRRHRRQRMRRPALALPHCYSNAL